jgi:photosystem II stability/assembly factor-like uncharacterized protein
MKYFYLILLVFCVANLQAQWAKLNAFTTENLTAVDFTDTQTGLVCGANKIWKTSVGGQNWTQVYTGSAAVALEGVRWANNSTAVAVGFNPVTNNAFILRSTNAGQSWTPVTTSVISLLTDVFFVNESVGYACGGNTTILKTTNGGSTWAVQLNANDSDLYSIFFVHENEGYAAGGVPGAGRLLKTTDGGQNWADLATASPKVLLSVFFPAPQVGYAAGQGGELIKTVDGGQHWNHLNTLNSHNNLGLYFLGKDQGFIVGGSTSLTTIQKTENGGATWTNDAPSAGAALFSIDFVGGTGYAAGINGTVLKTEVMVRTGEALDLNSQLTVFPNPVFDKTTVRSADAPVRGIEIYTSGGSFAGAVEVFSMEKELDVSALPPGNYFLKIKTGKGEAVKKLVKLRN